MGSQFLPGQKFFTTNAIERLLGLERNRLISWPTIGGFKIGDHVQQGGRKRWVFNLLEAYQLSLAKRLSDFGLPWLTTERILNSFNCADWMVIEDLNDHYLVVCDPGSEKVFSRRDANQRLTFKWFGKPEHLADIVQDRLCLFINLRRIKAEVDEALAQATADDFIITE